MTNSLENYDFFHGIWSFFLFPNTFEKGKCPEMGKQQNPLDTESVQKQENDKILKWSKNVPHRGAPNDLKSVWKQENDKILC